MAAWLYQMHTSKPDDDEQWNPELYRLEVWEGTTVSGWGGKRFDSRAPNPGDLVILYFCPTGGARTEDYGIYGWGVVSRYNEQTGRLDFQPAAPSDYLKMSVCCDGNLKELIKKIRKGIDENTIYPISFDQLRRIRLKIRDHVRGLPAKT
jgi:hypothetical protein